jgi:glycosyltransferase involved in cell wall biosynthesis
MGGTEKQSLYFLRWLLQTEHEPELLLMRPSGILLPEVIHRGIPYRILQKWDTRICCYAPRLVETLKEINPDVLLCMGRTANCYAAFIQKRLPSLPVVGTVRTGKTLFSLQRNGLRDLAAVVVNASWWKDQLNSTGLDANRIHVVHNSLLLASADEVHVDSIEPPAPTDPLILLNVSSFRPGKNHLILIRAVNDLKALRPALNWQLHLVGDGPMRKKCERLVKQLGLDEQVFFYGTQSDPTPYYHRASIAVSVSTEDSLPNFLIEAQSFGLPVVAWDYRGVRECFIPDQSGFLVDEGNREAFVQNLANLAENIPLRKEMGTRGRKHVQEYFNPNRQAQRLLQILETVFVKDSAC